MMHNACCSINTSCTQSEMVDPYAHIEIEKRKQSNVDIDKIEAEQRGRAKTCPYSFDSQFSGSIVMDGVNLIPFSCRLSFVYGMILVHR